MAAVTAVTAAGYTDFQVMDMVRRRAVCFSDDFGDGPKRELVDRLLAADPGERPSHAEVRAAGRKAPCGSAERRLASGLKRVQGVSGRFGYSQ